MSFNRNITIVCPEALPSDSALGRAWDELVANNGAAGFMQSTGWAQAKRKQGVRTYHQILFDEGDIIGGALCYLPACGNRPVIGDMPHGPVLPWQDQELARTGLSLLISNLQENAHSMHCIGIRVEPNLVPPVPTVLRNFHKAPVGQLPEETNVLDIIEDDEILLARMHPKCRYNIKLALRSGVNVREDNSKVALKSFYRLLGEAALRDDFGLEPFQFFQDLWETLAIAMARIFLVEHEGELLGGLLLLKFGQRATYLYGGISNHKRNLMAGYALQWQAIRAAQDWNCTSYDFYGFVSPTDQSHPYARFSRFKESFGGRSVRSIGAQEILFTDRLSDVVVEAIGQLGGRVT
jgi:lipid II:glycine glycyltransferase (peptidoglycan interpeptide bridge formation enzyme)